MPPPHPRPDATDARQLVDHLKEVVFQWDLESRWRYLNPAWTELTGHPVEESLGGFILDHVHPDDHAVCHDLWRQLLRGERDHVRQELRFRTRAGEWRWAEVYTRLTRGPGGEVAGGTGSMDDITHRREAQAQLMRRERYLRAVAQVQQRLLGAAGVSDLEALQTVLEPLGRAAGASRVYVFLRRDIPGRVITDQVAEWVAEGVSAEIDNPELQNLAFDEHFPRWTEALGRGGAVSERVRDLDPWARALMEAQDIKSQLLLPLQLEGQFAGFIGFDDCADERPWDALEVNLLSSAASAVSLFLGQRRAEAQRRQLAEQLLLSDRMASLGTLAAGVAHEINNPLAFVIGNLEYLLTALNGGRRPSPVEEREVLEEALEGAGRVRHIVRQLKTFARPAPSAEDAGPADLNRCVDVASTLAMNEIKHRARLVVERGDVPAVAAAEGKVCQVLVNLLVNAAQAIPEGDAGAHTIRVATALDAGGRVVVSVQDTGVGMSADVQRRIFDPFFTTKPVGVGTGLGLTIVHGLVRDFGGDIAVESTVGAGTTFRVALPAAGEPVVPGRAPRPAAPAQALVGRVLIVDDDEPVARAMGRLLEGHEVVGVHSGRAALEVLRADPERFDVVLCDLMMPDLSGIQLHEALAEARPELAGRFVFLTGGAFSAGAQDFFARVQNPRLDKPVDRATLRTVVEELVRKRRASQAA